jgi:hypothetical protein
MHLSIRDSDGDSTKPVEVSFSPQAVPTVAVVPFPAPDSLQDHASVVKKNVIFSPICHLIAKQLSQIKTTRLNIFFTNWSYTSVSSTEILG